MPGGLMQTVIKFPVNDVVFGPIGTIRHPQCFFKENIFKTNNNKTEGKDNTLEEVIVKK